MRKWMQQEVYIDETLRWNFSSPPPKKELLPDMFKLEGQKNIGGFESQEIKLRHLWTPGKTKVFPDCIEYLNLWIIVAKVIYHYINIV